MSIELAPSDDGVPYECEFFELLWKAHARVHITDTIVYKYGKMESWFFNKRRKSTNLDMRAEPPKVCKKRDYTVRRGDLNQTIMEAFTSHCVNDSELVATWVSGEPNELCRVLHLTKATLHQFLAYLPDKGHGLLQRWTAPFGGRNALLRTEWSPHHFSLELCTNWKAVSFQCTMLRMPFSCAAQSLSRSHSPRIVCVLCGSSLLVCCLLRSSALPAQCDSRR